jgi:hypothetical protein
MSSFGCWVNMSVTHPALDINDEHAAEPALPGRPGRATVQERTGEMRELVIDAWTMVVPKRVATEYLRVHPSNTRERRYQGRP